MTKIIKQKVIDVFEIGYVENRHYDAESIDIIDFNSHFVRFNHDVRRYIVSTAIAEIGEFELPITRINYIRAKHWYQSDDVEVETIGRCSGSWIKLMDGTKIYVRNTLDELKKMIEEQ